MFDLLFFFHNFRNVEKLLKVLKSSKIFKSLNLPHVETHVHKLLLTNNNFN